MAPIRILIVEDDGSSREALSRLLRMAGHQVWAADGCDGALAASAAQQFDLLLCDLTLSDGDGCDLLTRLRRLCPMRGIAITGHAGEEYARSAAQAGFSCRLLKPLELSVVLAAVNKVMESAAGRADGDGHST